MQSQPTVVYNCAACQSTERNGLAGLFCPNCIDTLKGVSSISVELRPGESQESLMRRFRKSVAEARILPIVRQKRWFTSKSEVRRINKQKAIRKARRNAARSFR